MTSTSPAKPLTMLDTNILVDALYEVCQNIRLLRIFSNLPKI